MREKIALHGKSFWSGASFVGLFLAGCSGANAPTSENETGSAAPVANAAATTAVGSTTPLPGEGRSVAVNVQGTAPVGVTVRVKSIELGTDATILDVSASYGGTITNDVALAGSPTYLLDEQGNRLMLKPPQDNQNLRITKGQTMDGKLVFLGAVAAGAKSVKLVFNDNNDGTSIIDPGLTMPLALDGVTK